ncbi:MAG: hypothetical protein LKJ51_05145 [Limosilactobacillus sp.]|jgi:competence protein CoiA|uniref:competence protein CoiA n=1 Tax=Limosilactobacillus sp. TaxID=2773925 RepID=UPI0025BF43E1|nr:competence protein CoiA family protein [Limosilactobacillus sp.]MCI1975286.1 hypothetical protein [Limosilactobacillus sp.]MCI2031448.1 hypothetical protein [Limosilactobacillus sp.]
MLVAKINDHLMNACDAQKDNEYYCPECSEHLILKHGKNKIAHFAHYANSSCVLGKGESYEHLLGKQQIFEWARKHGWNAEVEVYIASLEQRADILLNIRGQRVAIEFQCSPLSAKTLYERTQGYRKNGIKCFWLLGSPYMKKLTHRQTQKFIQKINHQYKIIFWDVKKATLKLITPVLKVQQATLKGINKDYRLLHKLAIQRENDVKIVDSPMNLPIICHQKITGIHFTNRPEIYWRCLVIRRLKKLPLFSSFSWQQWLGMLRKTGITEWSIFPCVSQYGLVDIYLKLFTKQLIMCGFVVISKQRIILIKRPSRRYSLERQYQSLKQLNWRNYLVDINKV